MFITNKLIIITTKAVQSRAVIFHFIVRFTLMRQMAYIVTIFHSFFVCSSKWSHAHSDSFYQHGSQFYFCVPLKHCDFWNNMMKDSTIYFGWGVGGQHHPKQYIYVCVQMVRFLPCRAVYSLSSMSLARPKSAILHTRLSPTRMLAERKSLWM